MREQQDTSRGIMENMPGRGSKAATIIFFAVLLVAAGAAVWLLFVPPPNEVLAPPTLDALKHMRERKAAQFKVDTSAATGVNVVFVLIDALRADHLSCYGYTRETSPNIDQLAADSTLFENHKSQSGLTVISMTSIFSSRYTLETGLGSRRGDGGPTLAEVMQAAGYYTAGVQTNAWLGRRRGFTRGFKEYHMLSAKPAQKALQPNAWVEDVKENIFYAESDTTADLCEGIIASQRDAPLFLYVHLMDVHGPYIPPERFQVFCKKRYSLSKAIGLSGEWVRLAEKVSPKAAMPLRSEIIGLYDGGILYADEAVGRIVKSLRENGLYDHTVIVLAADHGEAFLEHGRVQHANSVFDEILHTPFLLKIPGRAPGRYPGLTRNVDIAPTIFDAAGISLDWKDRDGISLLGVLDSGGGISETVARMKVKMGSKGYGYFGALQKGSLKYIFGQTPWQPFRERFFDLARDPGEQNDLAASRKEDVARFAEELATKRGTTQVRPEVKMDEDTRRRLKALGYLH